MQELATFAGGCFWGIEDMFRQQAGVLSTRVGYAGGHTENPTYHQVCSGETGHAEVVEVTFDSSEISYQQLLALFFEQQQHRSAAGQLPQPQWQYRSVVYYHNSEQQQLAQQTFAQYPVTEVLAAPMFWQAEDYHQQYIEKKQ